MNHQAQPIIAVGRDCDCGHPLIWTDGQQRCAIHGTHETPPPKPRRHHPAIAAVMAEDRGWRNRPHVIETDAA